MWANLDKHILNRKTENASKDFKSAIIKLEKEEVKTWHWWAYYLFFRIGVLYWHISSALKSIGYIKACGLVKRMMCLSLLNRGIWTYIFFSFCRLENNSKFGLNYDNDICCWSRIFFNPNYKSFAQCASKGWKHTWYLSFFLHWQNFWRIKFTPKNANFSR